MKIIQIDVGSGNILYNIVAAFHILIAILVIFALPMWLASYYLCPDNIWEHTGYFLFLLCINLILMRIIGYTIEPEFITSADYMAYLIRTKYSVSVFDSHEFVDEIFQIQKK